MATVKDDETKKEGVQQPGAPASDRSITRRNLLRAGLTLGIVSMVAGVASVAKSLFSPANPPVACGGADHHAHRHKDFNRYGHTAGREPDLDCFHELGLFRFRVEHNLHHIFLLFSVPPADDSQPK